jgi:hypothetical protein
MNEPLRPAAEWKALIDSTLASLRERGVIPELAASEIWDLNKKAADYGHVANPALDLNNAIEGYKKENKPKRSGLCSFTTPELDQYAKTQPPRELLVAPFLARREVHYLYGYKGAGKSWLSVALAILCAQGEGGAFLKFTGKGPGVHTMFVDGEMFAEPLNGRRSDIERTTPGLDGGTRIHWLTRDAPHTTNQPLNLFSEEGQQELENHIADIEDQVGAKIEQIFLDNLTTLLRGWEENKQESWAQFSPWLEDLRIQGRGVFLVHHANKMLDFRGSSSQITTAHSLLTVIHRGGSPGANFDFSYRFMRAKPEGLVNFNARLDGDVWSMASLDDSHANDDQIRDLTDAKVGPTEIAKAIGRPDAAGKQYVLRAQKRLFPDLDNKGKKS